MNIWPKTWTKVGDRRQDEAQKQGNRWAKPHWLPSPGNVILSTLVIATLLWTHTANAIQMAMPLAAATSTSAVTYQGRLANTAGTPLTGVYDVVFRLYPSAAGGTAVWTEAWTGANGVQVNDGLFSVVLGSLTPIPQTIVTDNSTLFLGLTVGTDSEMAPRVQFGSAPYAVQALTVPDGSITTAKLAPGIQFIPSGAIIMWAGATAAVPTGWQLCDGSSGTPDLRDRFVVGAGNSYAVGTTGGAAQVTLTVDQMPGHSHGYTDKFTDGNRVSGSHAWDATNDKNPNYSNDNKTTGAAGGGQAHENRPPYFALAYICKQ